MLQTVTTLQMLNEIKCSGINDAQGAIIFCVLACE